VATGAVQKEIVQMKKNDITFIRSTIYFVTLSKFKIMKKEKMSKYEEEAKHQVTAFNKKHEFKKGTDSTVACFFLEPKDLTILLGIPGFKGISIYLGLDDKEEEVLILAPAIEVQDANKTDVRKNVYSIDYTFNETKDDPTESTVVTLKSGQCPPPPPGCTTCGC
jgi:hypothetical protein